MLRDNAIRAAGLLVENNWRSAGQALPARRPLGREIRPGLRPRPRPRQPPSQPLHVLEALHLASAGNAHLRRHDGAVLPACQTPGHGDAPPGGFVLLNDPQFVEAAQRPRPAIVSRRRRDLDSRITFAFRSLTARDVPRPARARHAQGALSTTRLKNSAAAGPTHRNYSELATLRAMLRIEPIECAAMTVLGAGPAKLQHETVTRNLTCTETTPSSLAPG